MIDKAKRKTLKVLSAAAGSVAVPGAAIAGASRAGMLPTDVTAGTADDAQLAEIDISTRVSALHNDIEVVVTNAGSESVTITHMTPGVTRVARGEFDFSRLLKNGPLQLASGESVTVPLQRKAVKMWASPDSVSRAPVNNSALSDRLRSAVSIVTEGNSFASVTVA